jgi:serine/threonine-protein kinase
MSPSTVIHAGMEPYPGWRLSRFLGRGGFSEVWQAETADNRALALKFMPSENGAAVPREIRSLQMVRQLSHPNLIHVERVLIYQNYIVIAMELAEGGLHDLLEAYQEEFHTPIEPAQVCFYLSQAAEAIDFLNSARHCINGRHLAIQHCDVKPRNLLLFGDTVKLSDFGLASVMTGHWNSHRRAGTTAYSAPEVFCGRLSNRTDQYALAVSYCELRGGRMPFPNAPARFEGSYVPPPPDLTMVSEAERPIVARALNRVPQDRWTSCTEFMNQLAAVVS